MGLQPRLSQRSKRFFFSPSICRAPKTKNPLVHLSFFAPKPHGKPNLGYKVKPFMQVLSPRHRWLQIILGRVPGVLNSCLYEEARPEIQPLTLLYIVFHEQATPFVHLLLIDKWYPFQIPCLELCVPFNRCKCTDF